jgi:hypothetical protein
MWKGLSSSCQGVFKHSSGQTDTWEQRRVGTILCFLFLLNGSDQKYFRTSGQPSHTTREASIGLTKDWCQVITVKFSRYSGLSASTGELTTASSSKWPLCGHSCPLALLFFESLVELKVLGLKKIKYISMKDRQTDPAVPTS